MFYSFSICALVSLRIAILVYVFVFLFIFICILECVGSCIFGSFCIQVLVLVLAGRVALPVSAFVPVAAFGLETAAKPSPLGRTSNSWTPWEAALPGSRRSLLLDHSGV